MTEAECMNRGLLQLLVASTVNHILKKYNSLNVRIDISTFLAQLKSVTATYRDAFGRPVAEHSLNTKSSLLKFIDKSEFRQFIKIQGSLIRIFADNDEYPDLMKGLILDATTRYSNFLVKNINDLGDLITTAKNAGDKKGQVTLKEDAEEEPEKEAASEEEEEEEDSDSDSSKDSSKDEEEVPEEEPEEPEEPKEQEETPRLRTSRRLSKRSRSESASPSPVSTPKRAKTVKDHKKEEPSKEQVTESKDKDDEEENDDSEDEEEEESLDDLDDLEEEEKKVDEEVEKVKVEPKTPAESDKKAMEKDAKSVAKNEDEEDEEDQQNNDGEDEEDEEEEEGDNGDEEEEEEEDEDEEEEEEEEEEEKPDLEPKKGRRGSRKQSMSPTVNSDKRFQSIAINLINTIQSHKFSSLFLQPVSKKDVPDYYDIVYEPKDLKGIMKNIKSKDRKYDLLQSLERDIMLMFANCIMFNHSDKDIVNLARTMRDDTLKTFELFEEAEK